MSNQIFPLEFVNNMVILGGGGVGQSITLITQGTPGVGQSIPFDHARGPRGRSKYHIKSCGGGGGSKKGWKSIT